MNKIMQLQEKPC